MTENVTPKGLPIRKVEEASNGYERGRNLKNCIETDKCGLINAADTIIF